MKINIKKEIQKISEHIYSYRRDFHQYPELSFQEYRTAETISKHLESFGIEHRTEVGKTGVVGEIVFGDGPTIALRADMDALPIQEVGDLKYKSKNEGVMHACGHDGHMAILLGAANALSKNKKLKKGKVRFIFQPAEEGAGGARYMIKDGCLDQVDEIYGLHLWNYQPVGEIGVKNGPIMAAADMFDIIIKGKGGHGATPQGTVDAIVVASNLITMLQTIVSRNTNPLDNTVVTIGEINGGQNFNVIADEVRLTGTTRAYTENNRNMIKKRMQDIIDGVSKSFGAEIVLKYKEGYPPTVNHEDPTKLVLEASSMVVGKGAGYPYLSMGGEDFSYYLQKVPGCFFFVGSAPDKNNILSTPHHCSHFDIDERSLLIGASVYVNLIDNILS
jgi:amidohydrolase|tara:strand:+ start:1246 stop:2412 length:1167 start_codon:yes stop_codon:yes gene_type:complete